SNTPLARRPRSSEQQPRLEGTIQAGISSLARRYPDYQAQLRPPADRGPLLRTRGADRRDERRSRREGALQAQVGSSPRRDPPAPVLAEPPSQGSTFWILARLGCSPHVPQRAR